MEGGAEAALAVPIGTAAEPVADVAVRARRLAAAAAGAGGRLDAGARLSGAGGAVVSGEVAGTCRRRGAPRPATGQGIGCSGRQRDGAARPERALPEHLTAVQVDDPQPPCRPLWSVRGRRRARRAIV